MSSSAEQHEADIERIFGLAIELGPKEREEYVANECSNNSALREGVKRLLEFHEKNETSEFVLDKPILDLSPGVVAEVAESEGDLIGRYKLLERIGEGGMGVVYMAEQLEGVRRRVALKIIKLGMDTRQVIARFEAEQQAMAMFDHPNITRVFDAGSTDTGRPYFVMELVRGTNVAKYAKENQLNLEQRLSLFIDICKAVQHAHQKGIIHRDLKPSNILVTLFDGVPVPKVIDFGIAKAIGQQRLTDKTLFTRYSAMVGTPQYMSPEQAEMTGIDVDTRSDIYSLGVLLYELVTGSTPLSGSDLKELNPVALYETLRDADVETPSTRIAKTSEVDQERGGTPATSRQVGGELDWVIMKALSRDRTQRYASANEFAADVQRFSDGDSVLAAPPSKFYKLNSYLRKYRAAVLTVGIVGASLLVATIACTVFALNARWANQELSSANEQLTEYVSQLKLAEEKVRSAADEKLYDSAHSIAIERFTMRFSRTMDELLMEQFNDFEAQKVKEKLSASEDDEVFEDEDFYFGICFDFDQELLLQISQMERCASSIERIRQTFRKRKDVMDRVWEDDVFDGSGNLPDGLEIELQNGEHEHSAQCLALQKQVAEIIPQHRPTFFRILVDEYRRAFGEQDSQVADALQLLAVSLMDLGKFDEAEAHLREAAIMGASKQQQLSRQLLELLEKQRGATSLRVKQ